MSEHGNVESSHTSNVRAWTWWVLAAAWLIAAGFGFYGLREYDIRAHLNPDPYSIGYHTLQLFILHAPHLEGDVPWQLHVGRVLSAILCLWAGAITAMTVFRSETGLAWIRIRRGHIVVCGLGRLGMTLASQLRRDEEGKGRRVVAIETSGSAGQIATAYRAGVSVIVGDASNPDALARAAVAHAARIIAVCDDEQKNVAIAAQAGRLVAERDRRWWARFMPGSGAPVECLLFIADPHLRQTFQKERLFPYAQGRYSVNVRGLNLHELAARQVLRENPLDRGGIKSREETVAHLMIVGFGPMGQHLALQAAKIGHFANARKLKVTVFDAKPDRYAGFLLQYAAFTEICDADFQAIPTTQERPEPDLVLREIARSDGAPRLISVAVCWDSRGDETARSATGFLHNMEYDDATNLSFALSLPKEGEDPPRVLIHQSRRAGFGALFPKRGRGAAIGPEFAAFGMLEDTLSVETLLHERQDQVAKALHEDYHQRQTAKATIQHEPLPALVPWNQLEERFRESNRRAADHIAVKLRALDYYVTNDRNINEFSLNDDQRDLLASMEHESWCAEKLLAGYSYAPERNEKEKKHDDLLPWKDPRFKAKQKDREQVDAIPAALRRAGYGIRKLSYK